MGYRRATLYFHSGTGNSHRVAAWAAGLIRRTGAVVVARSMEAARPRDEIGEGPESLLALILPTHGFTAPWPALRFVACLPRRRRTHAAVVATRGATKIGRLVVPGAEGTATYLIALVLVLKGYRVRAATGIDMPANWIAFHPGLTPHAVAVIAARGRRQVERLCEAVLAGGTRFSGWIPLALGLLFVQVSVVYLVLGRVILAKLFFASERCTGCGLCADHCPNGAIIMLGRRVRRPYWTFRCVSCMRCMAYCPEKAVEASQPLLVAAFVLAAGVPVGRLVTGLVDRIPILWPVSRLPDWIVVSLIATAVLAAFYPLFHVLLRIPSVNRLFTFATLTHYYRRYHDPSTTLADLER